MQETLTSILNQIHGGGIYMYPIILVAFVMFTLLLSDALGILRARKQVLDIITSQTFNGYTNWNLFAYTYLDVRCGIDEIDCKLRENLQKAVLADLGRSRDVLLCASVVTLLGLLGTVSGMIASFDAIALFGFSDVKNMAGGISQALITTQSGLMVAVVGVVFGKGIGIMNEKLNHDLSNLLLKVEKHELTPRAP